MALMYCILLIAFQWWNSIQAYVI